MVNGPNEAMRFERLRAQDGQPLLPPPNLQSLCRGGGLNPGMVDEATRQWQQAQSQMQAAPSYPTEERLFWTAFLLARHYAEAGQRPRLPEIVRPTLPLLQQPRHQQILMGLLARNAAAMGNLEEATQLLPQLDAHSEDLQVDTNYRFTTAYVSLIRGDAQTALAVLGHEIDDVPINDAYDTVCGVFRAHAHEHLGDHQTARRQLQQLAPTPQDLEGIKSIVAVTPQIPLLRRNLPIVEREIIQLHQNAVVTDSGIKVGRMVLVPVIGSFAAIGISGAASEMLDPPLREIVPGVVIAVVVIGSILVTFGQIFKGSSRRKRLLQTGVEGTAKLMVVEQTGTRVNNQPMLRLRMMVDLPGQPPYAAVHHEVVAQIRLAQVQPGAVLPVRVDPKDRKQMAIAWQ